ncbi:MAG: (2Fe-2S)-binding protein [Euryarchaeota archaeon]|nr:(2Fe-2S)-binding protein [Euryarchaeota archaeon]|tara:strand:+ start:1242 stop:1541 length:300 start_codon:yes stop_codon:yes gene_type:complete
MQNNFSKIQFFRGKKLLGVGTIEDELSIIEIAKIAGVEIPSNCTSGTCGTCLVRLVQGKVEYPEELPPGLDEDIVEEGGILACCQIISESSIIDISPPI